MVLISYDLLMPYNRKLPPMVVEPTLWYLIPVKAPAVWQLQDPPEFL